MFNALPQQRSWPEVFEIYAWRLMLLATRLTHRLTSRWAPLVVPVLPLLWVPVVALAFGTVLGWSLVH